MKIFCVRHWSRNPSNFGWLDPQSDIWVPIPQIYFVWQASHTNSTSLFLILGLNCSGAGAKNFSCPELEPEIRNSGSTALVTTTKR